MSGTARDEAYERALDLFARDLRDDARDAFDALIAADPAHRGARLNRGVLLHHLGDDRAALADFDALVALDPDDASALFNRATARVWLGDPKGAAADLARAAERDPGAVDIRENLVRALLDADEPEAALAAADAGLARIDAARFHNVRGQALTALGRLEEALAAFIAAIHRDPTLRDAHHASGLALDDLGRPRAALAAYAAAASFRDDDFEPRFCAALSRLALGEFAAAWPDFRLRHRRPAHPLPQAHPELAAWDGAPLDGTLLLSAEQGFGDTLLFARFAAPAAALAARTVLEAPAPLLPLLAGIPGVETVARFSGRADAHCALPDLPGVLGVGSFADLAAFPPAYLPPPPARTAAWAERLGKADGPRIGIVWRGRAERRTAPHLTRAVPVAALLAALPLDAELIPLQPDAPPDDPRIRPAAIADFADTAALATLCDLVVSIDSGPAHAALAAGAETWVLPPFSPDWRWGLAPDATPWYPTARLLRQPAPGAWPLAKLKRALLERFCSM